jgi:subtilisin family serine protease
VSKPRAKPGWLVVVLAAAATAGAGPAGADPTTRPVPGADSAPTEHLCELVPPLEQLFGCQRVAAPSPSAPPPTSSSGGVQSSPASGGSSASPSLPPGSAPRRSSTTARYVPNLLLVTFRSRVTQPQIAGLLARAGVRQVRSIPGIDVRVVSVPPSRRAGALRLLRSSRWVETAQRDPVAETFDLIPNDTYWPDQWGLRAAGLPQTWNISRAGGSIVVAVVDTGVDPNQPDLAGALLPGIDLVNGGTNAADDQGHGTAVAGVIAARTNNHAGQAGVCWACAVLPIKAMNSQGIGDDATIAAAIVRATDAGARVINLSLGSPAGVQALADAVAYAEQKGALVVAAAGNSGTATPFYPAAYPGVISVAGADTGNHLYPWSNYGQSVVLAGPGCNVAPLLTGGYGNFCGTSSATPIVAGIAALALAADPAITGGHLAAALTHGAIPLAGSVRYGLVQAPAALAALGLRAPASVSTSTFRAVLSATTRTRTYARVLQPGRLAASLAFTGASRLTLSITDATGRMLARRTRPSPLRITLTVPAGSVRISVSGPPRHTRFLLTLASSATDQ